MTIVSPDTAEHTIKVATRAYTGDLTLIVRDEFTKETYKPSPSVTASNSYRNVSFAFRFNDEQWYGITLKDSNGIPVYRGKVYCTAQEANTFSVIKDKYSENLGYENKFMTL